MEEVRVIYARHKQMEGNVTGKDGVKREREKKYEEKINT